MKSLFAILSIRVVPSQPLDAARLPSCRHGESRTLSRLRVAEDDLDEYYRLQVEDKSQRITNCRAEAKDGVSVTVVIRSK